MNKQYTEIESLFKLKYRELCLFAYHFVEDTNEAEDIVQDIFIQLLGKNNLDNIDNLEAYLRVSIKNNSLYLLKKKRSFESLNEQVKNTDITYNEDVLDEEALALVTLKQNFHKALNELPKECKNVFLLSGLNGMKYKETAAELGISINTVKSQMKKAYKTMRKSLNQFYLFLTTYLTTAKN